MTDRQQDDGSLPAADGQQVPTYGSFAHFFAGLEEGRLNTEMTEALEDLAKALTDYVAAYGGKPKGSVSLKLDFKYDSGVHEIASSFEVKRPKAPRGRSICWSTQSGKLTPSNPKQIELFGARTPRAV